jgi:hypothetical protein
MKKTFAAMHEPLVRTLLRGSWQQMSFLQKHNVRWQLVPHV